MEKTLINKLSRLNKNEKLPLVEALWDSIASNPEEVDNKGCAGIVLLLLAILTLLKITL